MIFVKIGTGPGAVYKVHGRPRLEVGQRLKLRSLDGARWEPVVIVEVRQRLPLATLYVVERM